MHGLFDDFSLDFFSLKKDVAIITGGCGGLGRALTAALAKAGANLFIVDLKEPDEDYISHIEKSGVSVEFMCIDITENGAAEKIFRRCMNKFGRIDILINNAGICKINNPLKFDRTDWDPMINLNLTAAFEMSREAIKFFIPQRKGKIINVCSILSFFGGRWSPGYSATKHALVGLTRSYADDFSEYNIQINGIAPGYCLTDMTTVLHGNPKLKSLITNHIPAQRWGEAKDLMGAAVFLSSRASDYVSGHILVVDGGYSVR